MGIPYIRFHISYEAYPLSSSPLSGNILQAGPEHPSLRCLAILSLRGKMRRGHLAVGAPFSRKEVFQPHLPVRLPCYDLAPITSFALGRSLRSRTLGAPGFHGLTGGVYKARERIHRAMADARLLANPASWGRVADPSPN